MNAFLELDKINYIDLKESLINNKKDFVCSFVTFLDKNILTVQSSKVILMLRIYKNLRFQIFHYGVKCYISCLSKNHT